MSDIQNQYSEIKTKFDSFLLDAKKYKVVWEIKSYVNESFYQWNHRVAYDKVSKQMVTLPITSDNEFNIWKIRKIVRGIRNMVTKNDPRWHVRNSRVEKMSEMERRLAVAILQQKYKEEHIKDKIKDLMTHSLTKTIAWCYVWYDNKKDDIDVFVEDPFNIYTSPDWRLEWPIFVWKYMIRTIRKSLTDIKNSEIYKNGPFKDCLKDITAQNKQSESEYKDTILSEDYQIPVDENGSAIVQELYIAEKIEKKNKTPDPTSLWEEISVEEDQLIKEDVVIRLITKVWGIIIRDEYTPYNTFPFLAYQPERDKGLLYNPAWIEPLIELNRSLDKGYSNRASWLEHFAKWRYLVQKWSKMSVIKNKHAQIIEYTGSRPTIMESWNLPQEVNIHIWETERYMEDLWGIHSESMGRLWWNALSWVAIAQLQAADNNNVSEPVDNLKTFMEELAYRILYLASKYYKLQKMEIEWKWTFSVIWSEVKQKVSKEIWDFQSEVIEIKPLRNIEVEIVPGSAFSDLQARSDLVELKTLWVAIPDELIIETYKLGNTEQIMTTYEAEQEAKQMSQDWPEALEAKQAELENMKMSQWVMIAVQESENHQIHLAIHAWLLQQAKWNPEMEQLIMNHMQQHEAMLWDSEKVPPQEMPQNIWQLQ